MVDCHNVSVKNSEKSVRIWSKYDKNLVASFELPLYQARATGAWMQLFPNLLFVQTVFNIILW